MLRRSGYQGWVILLDEAELIGKLGLPSRAQAYVNLAQLLGLDARRPALDGIYVVLALASPFVQEVLSANGRNDLTKVPEWFTDPRRNKSTEVAPASAAMGSLVEASVPLESLSEANMQDGRIYEFGDRAKSNKVSKRPLTQASLKCKRWLKPSSLQRIPTPLKRCWMSHLQALSTIPLPMGKPRALYAA